MTGTQFVGDQVEVSFEVNEEVQPRITTSVDGDPRVGVTARRERGGHHAVDAGDADSGMGLRAGRVPPTGSLTEVAAQATKGLEEATKLIMDIRAGRGTVGKLVHR